VAEVSLEIGIALSVGLGRPFLERGKHVIQQRFVEIVGQVQLYTQNARDPVTRRLGERTQARNRLALFW